MRKGKPSWPAWLCGMLSFSWALFDSSFGYIRDVGLGDALCRSSLCLLCIHISEKREKAGVLAQWRPCKYRTTTSWLCASLKIFPTSPTLWPRTRCPAPPLTSHASHAFQSHCQEVRHCGQRQDIPGLFEFFSATTVTSLWRSSLPKLPANWGSVREASKFSQLPGAKNESQTLLSSENVKISRRAGQRHQQEGHVTRTLSLGTAMWMLSSSEPRSIPFSETYMMSVWACIAPVGNELRNTSAMMFFLLRSHNHDLLILWPRTLSQSRIRSLLLQNNHSAICTTWPPMNCAFAVP